MGEYLDLEWAVQSDIFNIEPILQNMTQIYQRSHMKRIEYFPCEMWRLDPNPIKRLGVSYLEGEEDGHIEPIN